MEEQPSDEVLKESRLCQKDFQCREGGEYPLCPVERHIEGDGLFIRKTHKEFCPYELMFGDSSICTCPARIEIYERYRR